MFKVKKIRLGSLVLPSNVLMAPMAGYSSYPFRMLCSELGAGLCFTEMVSCNRLKYKDAATRRLLFTTAEEKMKAAQLLGSDPRIVEMVAQSEYFDQFQILDINMGCPVPTVYKSGEGSGLLLDLKKAAKVIEGCKKSGKIVTVKCRIGLKEDQPFAAEIAKMCEGAGADMITIHGRTRSMMYDGMPYFDQIEQAKSAVGIPVIANGGIFSEQDAVRMMNETGADGVMIARYGLENPFIFSTLTGKSIVKSRHEILVEQLALASRYFNETRTISYMKKLAAYSMKKRRGTKKYKMALFQCGNIIELKEVLDRIFLEENGGDDFGR